VLAGNLCASRLAANDVVSLDYGSDANVGSVVVISLVDANNPAVGANEDFCSSGNLGRERERKIEFRPWSKIPLHGEVNASR
jgi:hypothetical protein